MPAPRCWARSLTGSASPGSSRARWRGFVSGADGMIPGRVIRDLAVMLADGGDCLSDLRAVRDQEPLFGPVASDSTAFRLIDRIAGEPALLDALRAARAAARERAWGLGVRPERIVIDIDATLVNAHTEKEGAAVNYRSGFGFHPMLAYLDETHEALAGVLRGGGAPRSLSPSADRCSRPGARAVAGRGGLRSRHRDRDADRLRRRGRRALPSRAGREHRVPGRVRSVHRRARIDPATARERLASGDPPGRRRNATGAQIAEITHVERLDLTPWPEGSRVIIRRERPHPGAQLKFTDPTGTASKRRSPTSPATWSRSSGCTAAAGTPRT